jgi:hypothetical protein
MLKTSIHGRNTLQDKLKLAIKYAEIYDC